jgi:NAD-dependent dihydropyrimidine dehydrogenase PreA subunit
VSIISLFSALPWLRISRPIGWLTGLSTAAGGLLLGAGVLALMGTATATHLLAVGVAWAIASLMVLVDLPGSTPVYPSSLALFRNQYRVELVDDACTGTAECVQVCPRNVLQLNGKRRKAELARPDDCVRCGACIVQCPKDALRFRFSDGRVVEGPTVRSTNLNMLGRRTVQDHALGHAEPPAAPGGRHGHRGLDCPSRDPPS